MHQVAELGVAAHWQYKQENTSGDADSYEYRWVRELLDILEHADDPDEFLEHTRLDLFQDQVFCFTPKGELIALPRGATPVDFAYEVHSEVGDACVGAKINGRLVQLQTKLRNGDQIEIVTSKPGVPSPDWESFVVTGKARARIRRFVRSKERTEYGQLGQAMLEKAFAKDGYQSSAPALESVIERLDVESVDDLYIAIGQGHVTAASVSDAVVNGNGARESKTGCLRKATSRVRHMVQMKCVVRSLFAGWSPVWRCIIPIAATHCRVIVSSVSKHQAGAWLSIQSIVKHLRVSMRCQNVGLI